VTVEELPDTAEEAGAVRRSLTGMDIDASMFEGTAATPDSLLGLSRSPVILHVASHAAIFDTRVDLSTSGANPPDDFIADLILPGRRAGLVLSGTSRPSLMFASDIARLPLRATQLAVLSGCNTGNGDVDLGEGVSSLRRSLEEAGAASTVTSLWPVPSQPTADLMSSFYRGLARRQPKSEALRLAKLALRDAGHLPSAWAGFLLAGDDTPLQPV
jgi:CHAT domain-containing protein